MRANNKGEGGIMALMALALQSAKIIQKNHALSLPLVCSAPACFTVTAFLPRNFSIKRSRRLANRYAYLGALCSTDTIAVLFALFILQAKGQAPSGKCFHPSCVSGLLLWAVLV